MTLRCLLPRPDGNAMASRHGKAPELEPVLLALYGALAEGLSFRRCLDVVAVPLRSHLSGLHHEDLEAQCCRVEVAGRVPDAELASLADEYGSRWNGQNLWLHRGIEGMIRRGYGDGDDVVSESELFAMPYYQHFLRRIDVRHGLGICLWHQGPGRLAVASFNRSAAEGPFSREDMAFVSAIRPHLVNAYAICMRAAELEASNRSLRAAMDRASIGMFALDADGRVCDSNGEAERLLCSDHGISRNAVGVVAFEAGADHQRFRTAMRELTCLHGPLTRSMPIVRAGRPAAEGLVLHLCAVAQGGPGLPGLRVVAFLSRLSASQVAHLDQAVLQSVLGLTPAEARVLMALRGSCDLHDVAQRLEVAPTTVRTHIKHVFAKTQTRKQSELVALAGRILDCVPSQGSAARP